MFKPKLHYIFMFILILFCFLLFYFNNTLKQNNINLKNLQQDVNTSAEIVETNTENIENIANLENQINDLVYRGEKVDIVNPVFKGQKVNIINLK